MKDSFEKKIGIYIYISQKILIHNESIYTTTYFFIFFSSNFRN